MALNGSGPISLGGATAGQSIALELGLGTTTTISLNQSNVRTLAGVSSGTIVMPTNFWGKANAFTFNVTLSTNTQDYNIRTAAIAAGWDQVLVLKATITINSGVYVGASNTSNKAITWTGSYPSGSTLAIINNGVIEGAGGAGINQAICDKDTFTLTASHRPPLFSPTYTWGGLGSLSTYKLKSDITKSAYMFTLKTVITQNGHTC